MLKHTVGASKHGSKTYPIAAFFYLFDAFGFKALTAPNCHLQAYEGLQDDWIWVY